MVDHGQQWMVSMIANGKRWLTTVHQATSMCEATFVSSIYSETGMKQVAQDPHWVSNNDRKIHVSELR